MLDLMKSVESWKEKDTKQVEDIAIGIYLMFNQF